MPWGYAGTNSTEQLDSPERSTICQGIAKALKNLLRWNPQTIQKSTGNDLVVYMWINQNNFNEEHDITEFKPFSVLTQNLTYIAICVCERLSIDLVICRFKS